MTETENGPTWICFCEDCREILARSVGLGILSVTSSHFRKKGAHIVVIGVEVESGELTEERIAKENKEFTLVWTLYCLDCALVVDRSRNRYWLKKRAQIHRNKHLHTIILGHRAKIKEEFDDLSRLWTAGLESRPNSVIGGQALNPCDYPDDPTWHNVIRAYEDDE